MPLDPAVFQQSFLYHEDTTSYLMQNMHENHWGIVKLEWDDVYLSDGILKLKTLEAIMPNFSRVNFPADQDDSLQINLKERSDEFKNTDLFIYLTLPDNDLSYNSSTAKPKYKAKAISGIKDLNDADLEYTVSFLKPEYNLYLGLTPPIGYIAMPLAKMRFTGIAFQFVEYTPPTVKISNSKTLINQVEELIKSGRDKLKYLLAKDDKNIENQWLMYQIGQIVFPLEHLLKQDASPYALFQHLVRTLSSDMTLSGSIPSVPEYNHSDSLAGLAPLIEYVALSLNQVQESYKAEGFSQKDGMFGIMLPADNTPESIVIGFNKKPEMQLDELIRWINNAIITSEDKLTTAQDQRIIGAKREVLKYSTDLDMKSTADMILVSVKLEPAFYTPGKMLCIMNFDTMAAPDSISLYTSAE